MLLKNIAAKYGAANFYHKAPLTPPKGGKEKVVVTCLVFKIRIFKMPVS
jgi:hypothetical protein